MKITRFNPLVRPSRFGLFALVLLAGNAESATLPNFLEESFTSVRLDFYVPDLTTSISSPDLSRGEVITISGPSSLNFSADAPENYSPGEIAGFASAEFGSMKARFDMMDGNAWKAEILTQANDIFTVAAPNLGLEGTPGSMTFVYSVTGHTNATVHIGATANPNRPADYTVASYGLSLTQYAPGASPSDAPVGTLLGSYARASQTYAPLVARAAGGAEIPTDPVNDPLLTFEVPFIYGEPTALFVQFQIRAELDRDRFTRLNPFRVLAQEYVIDDHFMDFSNTTSLTAIVNEQYPEASVFGVNTDYSHLVVATLPAPVPLPAAVWLLAAPISACLSRRRQSGQRKSL